MINLLWIVTPLFVVLFLIFANAIYEEWIKHRTRQAGRQQFFEVNVALDKHKFYDASKMDTRVKDIVEAGAFDPDDVTSGPGPCPSGTVKKELRDWYYSQLENLRGKVLAAQITDAEAADRFAALHADARSQKLPQWRPVPISKIKNVHFVCSDRRVMDEYHDKVGLRGDGPAERKGEERDDEDHQA